MKRERKKKIKNNLMARLSCQFRVNCITEMKKKVVERSKSALTKRLKYFNNVLIYAMWFFAEILLEFDAI